MFVFFLLDFCVIIGECVLLLEDDEGEFLFWWRVEGFLLVIFDIMLVWLELMFWLEGWGDKDIFFLNLLVFIVW